MAVSHCSMPVATRLPEHASLPLVISNGVTDPLSPAINLPPTQLGGDLILQTHNCNEGGRHDMEMHPPPINLDSFSTPKKRAMDIPVCISSCTPICDENLKPTVGMTFDSMEAVEEFYKAYAHNVGFSVRIGQNKTKDNVIVWRRFLCA
ncbi:uncharacterized protein [Triticum aestivum]|uniref:uncharacterized protein n=1 Tax=Triticum aestivum TaxID=4565 RepID=UPI001D004B82|nr:uncharacterized protein LOC123058967 [Triticum aestivum]